MTTEELHCRLKSTQWWFGLVTAVLGFVFWSGYSLNRLVTIERQVMRIDMRQQDVRERLRAIEEKVEYFDKSEERSLGGRIPKKQVGP